MRSSGLQHCRRVLPNPFWNLSLDLIVARGQYLVHDKFLYIQMEGRQDKEDRISGARLSKLVLRGCAIFRHILQKKFSYGLLLRKKFCETARNKRTFYKQLLISIAKTFIILRKYHCRINLVSRLNRSDFKCVELPLELQFAYSRQVSVQPSSASV